MFTRVIGQDIHSVAHLNKKKEAFFFGSNKKRKCFFNHGELLDYITHKKYVIITVINYACLHKILPLIDIRLFARKD